MRFGVFIETILLKFHGLKKIKVEVIFWTSFPNGKYDEKTCISIVFPIGFTIGIVGWTQFWKPKTSTGDNFTPKWSWGLIFSGSEVLMSTTIYYNMKAKLPGR